MDKEKMNKSTKLTLILGFLAILFLPLVNLKVNREISVLISFFQSSSALIGSFLGIWIIVKVCLRKTRLSAKETLFVLLGTFLALSGFALGRYGLMLIFWLPGMIASAIGYQIFTSFLGKMGNLLNTKMNEKIKAVEKEVEKKQGTS